MAKSPTLTFEELVSCFELSKLPFTISLETHHELSKKYHPLNEALVTKFLFDENDMPVDEFTEFMPCLMIPDTAKFVGLIYWRADLTGNCYILVTLTPQGVIIDKKVIGGTNYTVDQLSQIVGTIREDWSIYTLEGSGHIDLDPDSKNEKGKAKFYQLTQDGEITEI